MLFSLILFLKIGGQLKEFTDEESNFAALLQKAIDLEGVDRDTVYQLVSLLMTVCLNVLSSNILLNNVMNVKDMRQLSIIYHTVQTSKTLKIASFPRTPP